MNRLYFYGQQKYNAVKVIECLFVFMPPGRQLAAVRDALVCLCLPVCLSVADFLGYRVCIVNYFHNFQCIVYKLCSHVMDILKMCI